MSKILYSFLAAAVLAAAQTPAPNTLTKEEKAAGWILLFDGKTMKGWVDPHKMNPPGDAWTIEDGCLKATAKQTINEDLFSDRTFGDFELQFEWRISPRGNSGIKYRIQDHFFIVPRDPQKPRERFEEQVQRSIENPVTTRPAKGQDYVVGFEYQLTDNAANRDALSSPKHSSGALYDIVAPTGAVTRPVGEFNSSRLVVKGNHVEHWLNGVKVVDTTLDSPEARAAFEKRWGVAPKVRDLLTNMPKKQCPISLQNHGDDAWFRSLKIRSL